MRAYYNEFDPYAAAWLRNLIAAGLIAPGDVDERSIVEVQPDDLKGYTQCHFFAGIGGWSLALRMVGWADDRSVWTGSCPCPPFSSAGKKHCACGQRFGFYGDDLFGCERCGTVDERHLWPEFKRLITECGPAVVFGEQVASADGREWLTRVRADLEALGYAAGAADLCAAGVGAPHIRQRLWWVADNGSAGRGWARGAGYGPGTGEVLVGASEPGRRGGAGGVADTHRERRTGEHALLRAEEGRRRAARAVPEIAGRGADGGGLGDAWGVGRPFYLRGQGSVREPITPRSSWLDRVEFIPCGDGKARRIEPGLEPLAHGVPNRVGRLRAYGNAIVPHVAAEFIRAYTGA